MSADLERPAAIVPAPDPGYDDTGKSPDEIEEDITETRARLGEVLDALERQLAPRQLLERGVDMLKETMSGNGNGIGEVVRRNPVPLALIGAGVGWLVLSTTRAGERVGEYGGQLRDRVGGALGSATQRAGELAGQMRDKVGGVAGAAREQRERYPTEASGYAYARQKSGEAMQQAQQSAERAGGAVKDTVRRAQETGGAAWQRASDYAGQAGAQLSEAGDRFTELVENHPFAVATLGFLAGAVVASLLPRSSFEERFVAPTGERLRDQAASLGRDAIDRAQAVAERTMDAAVDAVRDAVHEASGTVEEKKAEEAQPAPAMSVPPG